MAILAFGVAGIIVGAFFGAIYLLIYFLTGGITAQDGSIISPVAAAAMYVAASGIGGALVGSLRSPLRSLPGSAIAGIAWTAPVLIGSGALYEGSFATIDWVFVLVGSILMGVPMGVIIRKEYRTFPTLGGGGRT